LHYHHCTAGQDNEERKETEQKQRRRKTRNERKSRIDARVQTE
jgi:hypothetical protein